MQNKAVFCHVFLVKLEIIGVQYPEGNMYIIVDHASTHNTSDMLGSFLASKSNWL